MVCILLGIVIIEYIHENIKTDLNKDIVTVGYIITYTILQFKNIVKYKPN